MYLFVHRKNNINNLINQNECQNNAHNFRHVNIVSIGERTADLRVFFPSNHQSCVYIGTYTDYVGVQSKSFRFSAVFTNKLLCTLGLSTIVMNRNL